MTGTERLSTTLDAGQLTGEWNELFKEAAAQRKARLEEAVRYFERVGDTQVAEFITRFLEKSAALHHSEIIVRALLGNEPVNNQNAWKTLTDEASGGIMGMGRAQAPEYYKSLHVDIAQGGKPLYDASLLLSQHSPVTVKDEEGNTQVWQTAGMSIAAHNRERGILVTLKSTAGANPKADTLAFSLANLENIPTASKGPKGLKDLSAQTLKTIQMLTGKEEPTQEDVLRGLKIVSPTSSGDENKQTMYVLQALVEIPNEQADSAANAVNGYWVSPDVLQRTSHLDIVTAHLEKAGNVVRSAQADPRWVDAFAQHSIVTQSSQQ